MSDRDEQDEVLREWCDRLTEALGLAGLAVDREAILGLAGVAAHTVLRPAAPLTTFVVGYAAGLEASSGRLRPEEAVAAATDGALALCRKAREEDRTAADR